MPVIWRSRRLAPSVLLMTACGGVRLLLSARFSCASIERARHQQRLVQFCSSLLSAEGRILFLCVSLCVFFSLSLARYADVDVDAASLSSSSVFMHVCKRRHQLGLFTIDPLLLLLLLERCRCVRLHRRCRRRRCQSSLVCIYIYYTRLRLCLLLLFSVLPVRACVRACVRAFSLSIFFIRAAFLYRKVERQVVDVYVDRLQPLVRERYSVELGALGDGKGVQIPLVLW